MSSAVTCRRGPDRRVDVGGVKRGAHRPFEPRDVRQIGAVPARGKPARKSGKLSPYSKSTRPRRRMRADVACRRHTPKKRRSTSRQTTGNVGSERTRSAWSRRDGGRPPAAPRAPARRSDRPRRARLRRAEDRGAERGLELTQRGHRVPPWRRAGRGGGQPRAASASAIRTPSSGMSVSHSISVGRRAEPGERPARRAPTPARPRASRGRRSGWRARRRRSPLWPARWISPTASAGIASR